MGTTSDPYRKSVTIKMSCGCTHIISNRLDLKRRGLCRKHRLERLHVTADDVSLLPDEPNDIEKG